MTAPAPWFFRKRFTVFGLVYGSSFFFGYLLAGFMGVPSTPIFVASGHPSLLGSIAVAFAVGGYAMRVWASSYLSPTVVWHDDLQTAALSVSGPYRFTRNPLYVGNLLQAIAVGLVCPWPVLVLLAISMTVFCFALIGVEERFLSGKLGAAYEGYRAAVPRFVPLPGRVAAPGDERGSLAQGVRSETMTAAFAAAAIVFVVLRYPH